MEIVEVFIVFSLALWRLVSLCANETGPFHIFEDMRVRIRKLEDRFSLLQRFGLFGGYTCEWCVSIWLGTLLTVLWLAMGDILIYLLFPLAGSAIVIIVKYIVQGLQQWNIHLENTNKRRE